MKKDAIKSEVKTVGKNLAKFSSVVGGVVVGSMVMKFIPRVGPAWLQKLLPGLAALVAAGVIGKQFSNEHVKAAALGIGVASVVDMVNKFTMGGTGIMAQINASMPKLAGLGFATVANTGDYPPSYFRDFQNAMTPRKLGSVTPLSLQGISPASLQGLSPLSLQGF